MSRCDDNQGGPTLRTVIFLLLWVIALPDLAMAHDPRPVLVEILGEAAGGEVLRWKSPGSLAHSARPVMTLSGSCQPQGKLRQRRLHDAWLDEQSYRCLPGPGGAKLHLEFPESNPSLAVVVKYQTDSLTHQTLLQPGVYDWQIPATPDAGRVRREYTELGVRHIWTGIDHLLFLVCLLLIAGPPRRLVLAVTGFTVSHSITLALATFGIVAVPIPFVEAMIALSVVFVAAEVVRGNRRTLIWRYPGLAAACFGLLHGFGFASALSGLGLPAGYAISALFFFNLGVEIGQLLFVAAALGITYLAKRTLPRASGRARHFWPVATASVAGVVAGAWSVARIARF